jgi:hypothetical protein
MKMLSVPLLALATASCAPHEPVAMTPAQQSAFDAAIAGRAAQQPQSCVAQRLLRDNRSYGEGVILFEGNGPGSVYVNRPDPGCPELTQNTTLVTRGPTDQLCRGDLVTVVDSSSQIRLGHCTLGDFVEYRRN